MTDWLSAKRHYLAAWLPFLPSERLNAPPDAPLVLVERAGNAIRIAHASQAALALGLTPGTPLADARACVRDIDAREMDRDGDRALLERLCDRCERFTPITAIEGDDALILDLTGCLTEVDLSAAFASLTVHTGTGNTPDAALARARHGERDWPVEALRMDDATVVALKRAGLRTIGDLAERPRAPLATRFGQTIVTRLARLLEEEDPHITPRRARPPVWAERRFAEPVARVDDVLSALRELMTEAAVELAVRGEGGRAFAASLFRSDGAVRRLYVETGRPTRDPALIARLLDERIAALRDPIDPGFGFDLIRFGVAQAEPLAPESPRLDGDTRQAEDAAALVERLSTRLGRERVLRLAPADTHIPEQAALALPAIAQRPACLWPAPEPGEPPLRPLHLFDPPQPVAVTAAIPDGPPKQFRWRRKLHDVAHAEGPERIAAEWWTRKGGELPGKGGLTRDYYRVEDVRGRRFWLFRHGLYDEKPDPAWFIHGLFA